MQIELDGMECDGLSQKCFLLWVAVLIGSDGWVMGLNKRTDEWIE
jgi:hypothetical protein